MLILPIVAQALDRITIAYFPEWPTPNLADTVQQEFADSIGVDVVWKPFEMGKDINTAMAQGDVQIAYAQEFVPFLRAVSSGNDFVITGIALEFPRYDSCIVHKRAEIRKDNAKKLEGRKVATLPGTVSHYRLLKILEYLGVDSTRVTIVPFGDGASVARALAHKDVVMGCAFGAPVDSMLKKGRPLLTAKQMEKTGLRTFDVVMMSKSFLEDYGDIARKFMDMTARANEMFQSDPDAMRLAIAEVAGMSPESADIFLDYFDFPTPEEQISTDWLGPGGLVENYAKELASFLVSHGKLESARDDYAPYIFTDLLN